MHEIGSLFTLAGRPVGGLVMIVGLIMLGGCVYHALSFGRFSAIIAGAGLVLTFFGGAVLIFGNPAHKGSIKTMKARPLEELRRDVDRRPFPYVLCLKKRAVVDFEGLSEQEADRVSELHMDCNVVCDHVEITSEDELALALANIEGSSPSEV